MFPYIELLWIYLLHLVQTNFKLLSILMILWFSQIGLDAILIFLLFFSHNMIFLWRKCFINFIGIPFPPIICQENLFFFLELSGLISYIVKGIYLNNSLIFICTHYNNKCSLYQCFVTIYLQSLKCQKLTSAHQLLTHMEELCHLYYSQNQNMLHETCQKHWWNT